MREQFAIGDYVVLQHGQKGIPTGPGVVVGHVVRIPGHGETLFTFDNELRFSTSEEAHAADLPEHDVALIEGAEQALNDVFKREISAAVGALRDRTLKILEAAQEEASDQ